MNETQKTYECICGRILYTPNSFNAHKRHCKKHLISVNKYDKYLASQSNFKKAGAENSKRAHDKADQISKESLIRWISEGHKCEKCGITMTEKFGPGRFCSRKCANSHIKSEESRDKVSKTLRAKGLQKSKSHEFIQYCPHCKVRIEYKHRNRKTCSECGNYLDGRLRKHHNIDTVASEVRVGKKLKVEYTGPVLPSIPDQNRKHGYFPRNQLSYAEQFWKKVLDNNNICYEHDFKVRNKADTAYYRLDFLIDGYFDLEIDGSQHQFCVLKDMNRTLYLESLGYKCFRLAWVNPNNDTNKMIVNCQIDQLFKELGKQRIV